MDVLKRIEQQVNEHPVIIYMKGTPKMPACGFSSRAVQALSACEQPFSYVDLLGDPEIFQNLPRFADWPTFPQVYIDGELVGGCDLTLEMFETGELKTAMQQANEKKVTAEA